MPKIDKIREKVLLGYSDANIDFEDLRKLLDSLGFTERIKAVITSLVVRMSKKSSYSAKREQSKGLSSKAGS